MNAVLVLILGFIVFFIGYRWYSRYIDDEGHQGRPEEGHAGQDVHGRRGVHADEQERPLRLPVQVDRGRRADHRPDHRHPVGLAARPDLDPGRRLLHRLGAGLLERDDGHAERGRLLRRVEPPADLAEGPGHPPLFHLLLSAPHRRAPSATSWSARPSS